MAAAEPIYPDQLSFALDRLYARLTNYVDARIEAIIVQMRIDKQESIARDSDLADALVALTQRVSNLETRMAALETRMTTLEAMQQAMLEASRAQTEDILRVVRDLHAEAMEAINELRPRGDE
jgi:hypothetical protein